MLRHFLYFFLVSIFLSSCQKENFVHTKNHNFYIGNKKYAFIGCNYWYGGYLFADSMHNGKKRLQQELDFLQSQGISNVRVFFCGEGDSTYAFRISPAVQSTVGNYNETILKSFDYFLIEAAKRNIKVVVVLNNNWEWSGGFGQYLEWAQKGKAPLPKTKDWDWDAYCKYIAQFYSNEKCLQWNQQWLEKIILRKNSFNGQYYKNDPTIMSWELANEPRPMDSSAIEYYYNWIKNTSEWIKTKDQNHLLTVGVEGVISMMYNEDLFSKIHSLSSIDYATLHLWPKTWQWYKNANEALGDSCLIKTKKYIEQHKMLMDKIHKPLVIEEFGMHRDNENFNAQSSTLQRDVYYKFVLETGKKNNIAGYNFWGAIAIKENTNANKYLQKGMAYSADPPQEEQGLYGVYASDSSTWKMIKEFSKNIE